jgi:hypothetical protein
MPRIFRYLALLPFLALPGAVGCAVDSDVSAVQTPPTNAACFGPDGTTLKYAASQDAATELKGVWDRCENTLTDLPSDALGVEFDQKFAYFLVKAPDGTLVRGASATYQRSVQLRVDADGIVLVLADANGTYAAYSAQITDAPRRLRIENTTTHGYMTLGARPL